MNELGKRLDRLATDASRHTELTDPSLAEDTRRVVPKRALVLGFAGALVVVAMLMFWQGRDDSTSLVTAQEPTEQAGDESKCSEPGVLAMLRSGIPTYDYDPAGSYLELFDASMVFVSGRITSLDRTAAAGTDFIELTLTDVIDLTGTPRPDVDVIAYEAVWAERSTPDPLATSVDIVDVEFVGFLSPWSGIRGGWAPGPEGLYVRCGPDAAIVAVAADAAGPGDPASPTIAELRNFLSAQLGQREAVRLAEEAAALAEEEARIRAEEQALIDGRDVLSPADLADARARWAAAEVGDYRYTIRTLGTEGSATSVSVTVIDGMATIDERFENGSVTVAPQTVEDLFDLADSADVVREVGFDPQLGYITLLSIDPDAALPGDEVRIMAFELYELVDIEASGRALRAWLPDPVVAPADVEEMLSRPGRIAFDELYELHLHPDVDAYLTTDDGQVCIQILRVAPGNTTGFGGSTGSCVSTTDFFLNGISLASSGGNDEPATLLIVPPPSYIDQPWTVEVDSASTFDTLINTRSALIVFDRAAPTETGRAFVRCECGDLAFAFSID